MSVNIILDKNWSYYLVPRRLAPIDNPPLFRWLCFIYE